MKLFKSIFYIFLTLGLMSILMSCSGMKDGVAPSQPSVTPSMPSTTESGWEYEMNYSEKVTTTRNWEGTVDMNDVSETLITANGWTVEISND